MTVRDVNRIPELLRDIPDILDRAGARAGAFLTAKLVERIDVGDPRWPPLSAWWAAKKKSSKIYIHTGELRALLTYRVEGEGLRRAVKVGIFDCEKAAILAKLEYGHERIPERPLMRPVADENEEALQELVRGYIAGELGKHGV